MFLVIFPNENRYFQVSELLEARSVKLNSTRVFLGERPNHLLVQLIIMISSLRFYQGLVYCPILGILDSSPEKVAI